MPRRQIETIIPKKGTARLLSPRTASLVVSRAGWTIFSDQICVSHLCLPDPSLVPADKSPSCPPREARSTITNEPFSTGHADVNPQLYFFTSSVFFPFLLPLRGSFQTGPLPVWPRGFFSELASLPILHHCFPVRYHTSSWAASSWGGVRNNCKGGLGSMCGRHDFSCWSPHCQDSA